MRVGVHFRVGAKAAKPDKPVLVLHGDGSFGLMTVIGRAELIDDPRFTTGNDHVAHE